jgi:hypothetical protein
MQSPTVVCLSSLFATDRILLHSTFIEGLRPYAQPLVVSDAVNEESFPRDHRHSRYFQSVGLPAGFPHRFTLLRHFENYLWDHKGMSASRESFWRLRKRGETPPRERAIRSAAKLFSPFGVEQWLERKLETTLIDRASPAATIDWLRKVNPAAVLAMYPFLEHQMVTIAAARKLGTPTAAFITSWDNITTKARLIYQYDSYIVWSERMKQELQEFYPQSRNRPVTIAGAPQYDVFFQTEFHVPRSEFLNAYGLDPARPVILYSLGSPNMIREDYGALAFLDKASAHPSLSRAQVIVRAHPGHLEKGLTELEKIRARFPQAVIQSPRKHWRKFPFQGEEAIVEWVNTLRHADVVINLASTMAVDAAIFDRPVVNIDFDPEPGRPNAQMIHEANHRWNHFSPIVRSGGVWSVTNLDEMIVAVETYLKSPELHRAERRWIVEFVCGRVDGLAGKRMAEAVAELLVTRCEF